MRRGDVDTLLIAAAVIAFLVAIGVATGCVQRQGGATAIEASAASFIPQPSGEKPLPGEERCSGLAEPGADTARLVSAPHPMTGFPWAGWWTATIESAANTNGVKYRIELAWNLEGQAAKGTCAWLVGGSSGEFYRNSQTMADQVQDALAVNQVRSLDLRFSPPQGDAAFPRNGFVNLAAPLADALFWALDEGIIERPFVAYGNSGGANLLTAFVLHHGGDLIVDGLVTGGGPWWMDLRLLCGQGGPAALIDEWTFEDVPGGCRAAGEELLACRSMLGPTAKLSLPATDVVVLIGTGDPNGAFFVSEAQKYLSALTARSERLTRPTAMHQILASQSGTAEVQSTLRSFFQ